MLRACRLSAAGAAASTAQQGCGDIFLTEPEKAEILRVWESKVGSRPCLPGIGSSTLRHTAEDYCTAAQELCVHECEEKPNALSAACLLHVSCSYD